MSHRPPRVTRLKDVAHRAGVSTATVSRRAWSCPTSRIRSSPRWSRAWNRRPLRRAGTSSSAIPTRTSGAKRRSSGRWWIGRLTASSFVPRPDPTTTWPATSSDGCQWSR
ncbi:MAG: LacI family DNA-binding transcriptional regulator [candidate division NC10 bacterium]|nr:LacI family DNA-binding transcriptional regulator [candidate division NC10 bacterium]